MNRKHKTADYLRIISALREARPDIALSTDIIVGFPGESDEDFAATLDVVRQVEFAQAYSFKYSARPGTPAAERADQIAESVKSERLRVLQNLLKEQQAAFNLRQRGKTLPILWERIGRSAGQIVGRSPYLQAVHAEGPDSLIGSVTPVKILSAGPNSLAGILN
jgi:tRNA-2-methylthio-N6-dimethylallyladenosine synthase